MPVEMWDIDAVFITQNWDVGYNIDQLDLPAYTGENKRWYSYNMHTLHSLVTTVLSNYYYYYYYYFFLFIYFFYP